MAKNNGKTARIPVTWLPGARFAWVGDFLAPFRGIFAGIFVGLVAFWLLSHFEPQCRGPEDDGNLKTAYFGHIKACKNGKWTEIRLKTDVLEAK